MKIISNYDYIIVGSGFSGSILARKLAEKNKKILVLEKRKHIAGNMYDYYDKNKLLIHKYGPHIIMTDSDNVYNYIKEYVEIIDIEVKMEANIDGIIVPLPINLNSIKFLFNEENSKMIIDRLIARYGMDTEINIIDLLIEKDEVLKMFASYIYKKVFVGYNLKMWNLAPNELDKNIVARVPIRINYNDIRSTKKYNFVPKHGYTDLFKKILEHENITVETNCNASKVLKLQNNRIRFNNKFFSGKVVYTGPLDELFNYCFGELPYRAVFFKKEIIEKNNYFNALALTYPTSYKKFRTSDMSRVTGIKNKNKVALVSEYSGLYSIENIKFNIPSYPILNETNKKLFNRYKNKAKYVKNFIYTGRLAEYKYYDMSETIEKSLELAEKIGGQNNESI